jgi:hypothetical protein
MSRQAVAAVGALAASVLFGAAPAAGEEVAFSPIRVRLQFIRASPSKPVRSACCFIGEPVARLAIALRFCPLFPAGVG